MCMPRSLLFKCIPTHFFPVGAAQENIQDVVDGGIKPPLEEVDEGQGTIAEVRRTINKYKAAAKQAIEDAKEAKENLKERLQGKKVTSAEDGEVGKDSQSQVVLRLRVMYRKCVEYRLAHSLYETKFHKLRIRIAFFHLVRYC